MKLIKYLPPSIALFIFSLFLSRSKAKQAPKKNTRCLALIPARICK